MKITRALVTNLFKSVKVYVLLISLLSLTPKTVQSVAIPAALPVKEELLGKNHRGLLVLLLTVPFPVIKRLLQMLLLNMNLATGDMKHLIKEVLQVGRKCWAKAALIKTPMVNL